MFKRNGLQQIDSAVADINKAVETLEAVSSTELQKCEDCSESMSELASKLALHKSAAKKADRIAAKFKEFIS